MAVCYNPRTVYSTSSSTHSKISYFTFSYEAVRELTHEQLKEKKLWLTKRKMPYRAETPWYWTNDETKAITFRFEYERDLLMFNLKG